MTIEDDTLTEQNDETDGGEHLARRLREERLAMFERALSSLSHAFGTPLQVISGRAALIRMDQPDDDRSRSARIIEDKVGQLVEEIRRMLTFARTPLPNAREQTLESMLNQIRSLAPVCAARGLLLTVQASESEASDSRLGHYPELQQIAENLIEHFVLHAPKGAALRITGSVEECAPPAQLGLRSRRGIELDCTVDATLPGPPSVHPHEPWLDDHPLSQRDDLLRLSVCYGLTRRLGGWILWTSTAGKTSIQIFAPFD